MRALSLALIAILSGCATITADYTQPIMVLAVCAGSARPVAAECVLKNNKGQRVITSPGTVAVPRDSSELMVQCTRRGEKHANAALNSSLDEKILGNFVISGIGAVVDLGTGAAFNYPSKITVLMDCTQTP